MKLYAQAINQLKINDKQISELRKEIHKLPPGRLECIKRNNTYRWRIVVKGEKKYLNRSQRNMAERLAYKRTLYDSIEQLECENIAMQIFTKLIENSPSYSAIKVPTPNDIVSTSGVKSKNIRVCDLINPNRKRNKQNPEIESLSQSYWDKLHPELANWDKEKYDGKSDDDSKHKVRSISGRKHESKDEAMIDNALMHHGLKVRYEPRLELSGKIVHPDFYIMNPKTNVPIFWEHFGMIDNPIYLRGCLFKLRLYMNHGYIPNVNFIMTFMGGDNRIDSQYIESVIEYFFE